MQKSRTNLSVFDLRALSAVAFALFLWVVTVFRKLPDDQNNPTKTIRYQALVLSLKAQLLEQQPILMEPSLSTLNKATFLLFLSLDLKRKK